MDNKIRPTQKPHIPPPPVYIPKPTLPANAPPPPKVIKDKTSEQAGQ